MHLYFPYLISSIDRQLHDNQMGLSACHLLIRLDPFASQFTIRCLNFIYVSGTVSLLIPVILRSVFLIMSIVGIFWFASQLTIRWLNFIYVSSIVNLIIPVMLRSVC